MIYIVAGGPTENIPNLAEIAKLNEKAIWIGVDAGVLSIIKNGITPDFSIGDFDSVAEDEFAKIKGLNILEFPSEKDESDLELALNWAISKYDNPITVFGATGGRLDHELVNIMLLTRISKMREVWIKDIKNEMTVLLPGEHQFQKNEHKYISLISIDASMESVTLSGLKYPLNNAVITRDSSVGLSNEFVETRCNISFKEGICLVVRSSD